MINKLLKLGISNILVADDRSENILAARKYFEQLGGISTTYFNNGKDAVEEIKRNYSSIALVLTDLEMETPNAGVEVALTGFEYLVPSYIITGGPQHRGNNPTIRVIPEGIGFEGTKESPETWKSCLESIINPSFGGSTILNSVLRARKFGVSVPFKGVREMAGYLINGEVRTNKIVK